MKKLAIREMLMRVVRWLRPYLSILVLLLVLKYTGLLAGISTVAGSVVMKTGAMDIDPDDSRKKDDFNYNFKIKDLRGKRIDFAEYKNKVLFINVWATWCGPCRMEMPGIQSLYSDIKNDSVVFIMLSVDQDAQSEKVSRFVQEKEYTFPVYMPSGTLPRQLQVANIPTTLVVNRAGKIVSRKEGAANYDTEKFRAFLRELLQE